MPDKSLLARSVANLRPQEAEHFTRAVEALDALANDNRWSEEGRKAEAVKYVSPLHKALMGRYTTSLPNEMATHQKALDTMHKDAEDKAGLTTFDAGDRIEGVELGRVVRGMSPAERKDFDSTVLGNPPKNPRRARLLQGIDPAVAGFSEQSQELMRRNLVAPHLDEAKVEEHTTTLNKLTQEKASLAHVLSVVESMTDRSQLRQASGSTLIRLSDLSDAEKAEYIRTNGLDSFKQLVAQG